MKTVFNPPYNPGETLVYTGTGFLSFDKTYRYCKFDKIYDAYNMFINYNGISVLVRNSEVRRPVLKEWTYMRQCSWRPESLEKYMDVEIVKEVSSVGMEWDDYIKELRTNANFKTQNTYCFVILANGKAVGLNENPGKGWGFPVVTYKGKI